MTEQPPKKVDCLNMSDADFREHIKNWIANKDQPENGNLNMMPEPIEGEVKILERMTPAQVYKMRVAAQKERNDSPDNCLKMDSAQFHKFRHGTH